MFFFFLFIIPQANRVEALGNSNMVGFGIGIGTIVSERMYVIYICMYVMYVCMFRVVNVIYIIIIIIRVIKYMFLIKHSSDIR